MTVLIAVGLAMLVKDLLGAAYVVLIERHRDVAAGGVDAVADIAAALCYGATGAELARHGVSIGSIDAAVGIAAGSVLGTVIGGRLTRRLFATSAG